MSWKRMLASASVLATVAFAIAAVLASGALAGAVSLGGPACTSTTKHVADCSASWTLKDASSCSYTFTQTTKSGPVSYDFDGTLTATGKESGTCSVSASLPKGGNYSVDVNLYGKDGKFAASSSGFIKVK
jgi:hypothetical protein